MTQKAGNFLATKYSAEFKRNNDSQLGKILNFMSGVEPWTVDFDPSLRGRFARVKFPLNAISPEDTVKLSCYCTATRAMSFISLKSSEHKNQKAFFEEIDGMFRDSDDYVFLESVNVLKTRMAFLTKLGVLSSVFSYEKRERVKSAVRRIVEEDEDGY